MSVKFRDSETKANLMRAFAGESQARNRYVFSADLSKKEHLHVIEQAFRFTAAQEDRPDREDPRGPVWPSGAARGGWKALCV